MRASRRTERQGFTLIELLVVVGIIAILAAILTPALMRAVRKAHETRTLSMIHQTEAALQMYSEDYGDYPPTTWREMFGGNLPAALSDVDDRNEGIEVMTACLATQSGGPYLEYKTDMIGNTDDLDGDGISEGDFDAGGRIRGVTNWYFGGGEEGEVFELVDWWGNPLVYVHNRDYAEHDGWLPSSSEWDDPTASPQEHMLYQDVDRAADMALYCRSWQGIPTRRYPNLNSFQLYSIGADGASEDNPQLRWDPSNEWWYVILPLRLDRGGFLGNWEEEE